MVCPPNSGDAQLADKIELKNAPDLLVSHMTLLPMFHLGAFICLFSWAWMGWALNLGSDIRNFYKDLKRMPSQAMAVVPVLMESLHNDVMRGRRTVWGSVGSCGSSAMFDPQMLLDLATHGMLIIQLYGSTETCGDGIINFAQDAKHIGAVGKARLLRVQARRGRRAVHARRLRDAGLL